MLDALHGSVALAFVLILGGALYIHVRWRRSPHAYRAMIAVAVCFFVAGSIVGVWVVRVTEPKAPVPAVPTALTSPLPSAPIANPVPSLGLTPFDIAGLHYDPAHAVLPNPKLTPGDVFPAKEQGSGPTATP
jgi:hypothetical protein